MIKLTKKTKDIIGTIVKHIHWNIWSFCLLYLVFKETISLPFDFLYNFNFIPEVILNLSKLLMAKPIETTIPEIHVIPTNNDEFIDMLKSSILSLQQEIALINANFNKLFSIMQDNNNLIQQQIVYQKDLFNMVEQKFSNLSIANEVIKVDFLNNFQEINKTLRLQANGQLEIAHKIISNIHENMVLLTTLNNNVLNIDKSILSIDINKPLLGVQDLLNQVVINQKDLQTLYQSTQHINLQSFDSILDMQNQGFQAMEENLKEIFSKMHEVRNHNLGLHQQLIKNVDIKLLEQQTEIVSQVIDEINRPKTSSTQVSSSTSKFGFFNKK